MNYIIYNMDSGSGSSSSSSSTNDRETKLVDVEVTDENVALNVLVSFLNLAQKRGAFTIDEAAKIWECVKKFQKKA